jgi:hypothetical protein
MKIFENKATFLLTLIIFAAISRLIPHPHNVTPMFGICIFGSYYFSKNWQALLVTLASWWLSDLVLNNTLNKQYFPTFTWVSDSYLYSVLSLLVIHFASKLILKNTQPVRLAAVSILASLLFFTVSNYGSFLQMYPHTFGGLVSSYIAGWPFLRNAITGDLFYTTLLFGVYHLASKRYHVLAVSR